MSHNVWGILRMRLKKDQGADTRMFSLSSDLCFVGSDEDCYVRIPDAGVAGKHCLLTRDPDGHVWLTGVDSHKIFINDTSALDDLILLQGGETFYLRAEEEPSTSIIEITFKKVDEKSYSGDNLNLVKNQIDLEPINPGDKSRQSEIAKDSNLTSILNIKSDQGLTSKLGSDESVMESNLTCSICALIFFECCSVQPCLHSFCTLCYLQWMALSDVCPVCRMPVQNYAKNHQLDALATLFVTQHPDKGRTNADKEKIKNEIQMLSSTIRRIPQPHWLIEAIVSVILPSQCENNLQSTRSISSSFNVLLPGCPVCGYVSSHYVPSHGSTLCPSHNICACCLCPVPSLIRHQSTVNLVQCEICCRSFCALLNTGGCPGCSGACLLLLSDLRNMTALPSDLLLRNTVETSILKDYLAEEGVPVSDFIQSCLNNIDPNLFGASGPTEQSPVCRDCSLQFLSKLAYQQREAIPRHELPVSVTARPDCYYGRNCRTQRTKMSHAHRYNHICEQRRS